MTLKGESPLEAKPAQNFQAGVSNMTRQAISADELETLLAEGRQICVFLGAVDTGKTTLAFELARRLATRGRRVALVDSDVGQSHIGPPTTIGWAFITGATAPEQPPQPESLYFVGNTSPARHLLPVVVGTKKMADAACSAGADVIVVDTSGMVHGFLAWRLKYSKIDLISPTHIVAVQRETEIEHLLCPWEGREGVAVHRLRADPNVRTKSTKERAEYRRALFREHFAEACEVEFSLDEVRIVDVDAGMEPQNDMTRGLSLRKGQVVGLSDAHGALMGLGMVHSLNLPRSRLVIWTSVRDIPRVMFVHLGEHVFQDMP